MEATHTRSLETLLTLQKAVEDLENKLGIYERWEPKHPDWISTQKIIEMRKYYQAVDHLEGLVVARLFELAKAHQSGTGTFHF